MLFEGRRGRLMIWIGKKGYDLGELSRSMYLTLDFFLPSKDSKLILFSSSMVILLAVWKYQLKERPPISILLLAFPFRNEEQGYEIETSLRNEKQE